MPYVDHFKLADDIIDHLDTVVPAIGDPFVSSRYVGMVAISAVTVYELCIKDIFRDFGTKKHKVFGKFTESSFRRINGRIKLETLKKDYIRRFGGHYESRFKSKLKRLEAEVLRAEKVSVSASYGNVIQWRNSFAHEGRIPSTVTYAEAVAAYRTGKHVVHCLAETMRR